MKIFIHRNGQVYGPYPDDSIRTFLENGLASPNDLAWTRGQSGWIALEKLLGISNKSAKGVEEIKEWVEQGEIDFAYDMVCGLNDQEIILALLQDCKIDPESGCIDLPSWFNQAEGFFLNVLDLLLPASEKMVDPSILPSRVVKLQLFCCDFLKNLNPLRKFKVLEFLKLNSLQSLSDLKAILECENLQELEILSCRNLDTIDQLNPIKQCPKLSALTLLGFDCISSISFFEPLTKLEKLSLNSQKLHQLEGLSKLQSLQKLCLDGCVQLDEVGPIGNLHNLIELDLGMCEKIENLDCLEKLPELEKLNLSGCFLVEKLPALEGMKNLQVLNLNGSSIPLEVSKILEENEVIKHLTLPNGSTIEKFYDGKDPDGVLPRIEFYLGGYGLEGYEGNLTEAQYAYWKDKDEAELIDHCGGWDQEDEDIPEDARLETWHDMQDVSAILGCEDGTLGVTEYRKAGKGWQKKYQEFMIVAGGIEDENVQETRTEDDRVAPTGPFFRGYSAEKGCYCHDIVEGKTFDSRKLNLHFDQVFGGDYGEAVTGLTYDGEYLEWMPEGTGKGYYFEIMPPEDKD